MKEYTCSIAKIVMTTIRNDFIVDSIMISSMELNWVTDLGSIQCLGEEIIPFKRSSL